MNLVSSDTQKRMATYHPEAAIELDNLQKVLADTALDPGVLRLCSDYFHVALRNHEWAPPNSLTELEAACIAVCEQFMVSVSNVDDAQIAQLSRHLNPDELYNLMYAIYLIEMSQRLDLTLECVLQ